uniref:Uncharacterized protein n=1 Tax=Chromera velia CCMP2878 TaxID=1169474 RepID=A0A0G4FNB7_9ALVE|eukprot:Cvel_17914.t1-p1 / transcript=Cvel_17914.t1 / gene=Cvel_17914 / organism=Chromera_velia_CCMP2878 / gene_product=hypothetical protein / transcript_product=hypothetical protein / location=Cvel_scaffold1455:15222-16346(-) / protein_length=73 / sequence_SO=supercontig / SO=protein_coding / is_pseudo=false
MRKKTEPVSAQDAQCYKDTSKFNEDQQEDSSLIQPQQRAAVAIPPHRGSDGLMPAAPASGKNPGRSPRGTRRL